MVNPVGVDDLESRWPFTSDLPANAQMVLDKAWRALIAELPVVDLRSTSGVLDPDLLADVICDAAMRTMRNPEGYVKGTTTIDDRTKSWELNPDDVSSDLYFTSAEKRRVLGVTTEVAAFTVTPASPRSRDTRGLSSSWSPGWQ